MASPGLAEFLEELQQSGELVRVDAEVDPKLEAAEIARRITAAEGKAIVFGRIRGLSVPLAVNLLGSPERICRAMAVGSLDEAAARLEEVAQHPEPTGWLTKLTSPSGGGATKGTTRRVVRTAAAQQVVCLGADVDLGTLPIPTCMAEEGGPTITAGRLFTLDPETGQTLVGRFDFRVLDRNRLAACWAAADFPAALLAGYRRRKEPMPVAIVLGGHPAGLAAAMMTSPSEADPLYLESVFRGRGPEVVKAKTIELQVPADAEIILEGLIQPNDVPVDPGPVATPLGSCVRWPAAPVVRLTAMTHRVNPVLPALMPGPPPNEWSVLRRTLIRIVLPVLRGVITELVDLDLPLSGAARHLAVLSIRKTYAGQARRVAQSAWGLRALMFSRVLVIVDEGVDVADAGQLWAAVAAHVDPAVDVFFQDGPPDPLDPVGPSAGLARRMGIDATQKLPGES